MICDWRKQVSVLWRWRRRSRISLCLGVTLSIWAGSAFPEVMHVADYLTSIHQKRFADKSDNDDFMQMLVSASVHNVVAAATHLIDRGTADSEVLAFAYVKRSRFWDASTSPPAAVVADHEHAVRLSTLCKPFYLVSLGEIFAERELSHAMSYFDQAIALSPGDPYVFFRRGRLHRAAQQNELALRDFDEVIRLEPRRPAAYIQRAEIRRALGDVNRALQDYYAAFDRADPQLIKNAQWAFLKKKLYRGEPDGRNNVEFRSAISACVRESGCKVISWWSADTGDDRP
jgi:hypothetical protein